MIHTSVHFAIEVTKETTTLRVCVCVYNEYLLVDAPIHTYTTYTTHTHTHREWYLLYASLIQDVEDMDLCC